MWVERNSARRRRGAFSARRSILMVLVLAVAPLPAARLEAVSAEPVSPLVTLAVPGGIVTTQRVLAPTFDDGPSTDTPQILAILHAFHVHATFFLIGRQVAPYEPAVRSEVRAGDEVGNHTYDHFDLLPLSDRQIISQLAQTQQAIRAAAGIVPRWFRPPDGAVDDRVVRLASSLGLGSVLWNVDPRDWSRPGTSAIIDTVVHQALPGSIIIMHDGGGDRSETAAALPIILRTLQARGYRFLTVSELFGLRPPTPCNARHAARWFAAAGIAPQPAHAIYRAWLSHYCVGRNLGPATSGEYQEAPLLIAQDFADTAHRVEWVTSSGSIRVVTVWPWAAKVFATNGIRPQWHSAITHAWFEQFFQGRDWGPATGAPRLRGPTAT